jgi:hypothetical protein
MVVSIKISLLGCNMVYLRESPIFWKNILPSSSGLKSQSNKKPEARDKLSLQYVPLKRWALSELHRITTEKAILFINSIWNKNELPKKRREAIIVFIYKNDGKTDDDNAQTCHCY